jgi:hypothetical protein
LDLKVSSISLVPNYGSQNDSFADGRFHSLDSGQHDQCMAGPFEEARIGIHPNRYVSRFDRQKSACGRALQRAR